MARRTDANQATIVAALRAVGASVTSLHEVGKGVPDLLVGFRGENWLLEVKNDARFPSRRRLNALEAAWHDQWRGQVTTVETVDDALRAVGAL